MISGKPVGDWPLAMQITTNMEPAFQKAAKKAVLKEAHFLRTKMVRGIRQGAPGGKRFLPLAASTLAVRRFKGRGGKKPLIVSGALRNSIRVKKEGDSVFVGVLRSAAGNRANIAEIQEFGSRPIVIPMTPKARRFLMKIFRESNLIRNPSTSSSGSTGQPRASGGGLSIAIVRIPPRPFVRPVVDRFAKPRMIKNRFEGNLARELGGMLGTPT